MATVRRDVCGEIFRHRYLASHKRLSHNNGGSSRTAAPATQKEAIPRIVCLCEILSRKGGKPVPRLWAAKDQRVQKNQKIQ
jgi:hypothetical protein